jgi:hypothetical protein
MGMKRQLLVCLQRDSDSARQPLGRYQLFIPVIGDPVHEKADEIFLEMAAMVKAVQPEQICTEKLLVEILELFLCKIGQTGSESQKNSNTCRYNARERDSTLLN